MQALHRAVTNSQLEAVGCNTKGQFLNLRQSIWLRIRTAPHFIILNDHP